ncbi:MAG TPA: DNA repair protein RadA [Gemmatimonadales bacterium]
MAARRRTVHRCAECGADHPKWAGRCEGCGAWNTLVEEIAETASVAPPIVGDRAPVRLADVSSMRLPRLITGLAEFDFVLGGGLVPGSLVLVGGEPGVGKSTLLLQAAARLDAAGVPTLYAAGEESVEQVAMRAARITEDAGGVAVLPEVRVDAVVAQARAHGFRCVIVDSIQTSYTQDLDGAPGNVGQVRESAARLMRFAKETGAVVLLIGHVTRGGMIAGPKTLEHMVDTVIYFDGDTRNDFRILRAVKNRFGSVDEVGVFEMAATGLVPVPNPSAAFLGTRDDAAAGSAVTALVEGTRPLLVEVQALAAKAGFGTPQRVATGLDHKRLAMLLAVLERRAGIPLSESDVFVNVTGGARLVEPAADLAVLAALVSSAADRPLPPDTAFVGEVGLGGEVRPVSAVDRRLSEAERHGFRHVVLSARNRPAGSDVETIGIKHVSELGPYLAA